MKKNVETMPVNLQQGFFLSDGRIVAAYSHHNKTVAISMPYRKSEINLPENYKDYEVIHTDGFHIEFWNSKGNKYAAV